MSGFSGMRGSESYLAAEQVDNWRAGILQQFPNGRALLTGLTSRMKKKPTTSPILHYLTEAYRSLEVAVTKVYTDVLTSALALGQATAAGTILNVKMAAADTTHFRPGNQVLLRVAVVPGVDVNAKVLQVVANGASSYLQVKLLEADDNVSASYDLSMCDICQLVGDINPEASEMPQAVDYDPVEETNYTQIIQTPLKISRTAMRTKYRTGDMYKDAKARAYQRHMEALERIFLYGTKTTGTGANGLPERTTEGMLTYIKRNASANCLDYRYVAGYAGDSWATSGKDFIFSTLEKAFRYGDSTKAAFCGSGALLGFNYLAETYSQISIQPGQTKWGMKYKTLLTPWGDIEMSMHPMFNISSVDRNKLVIFNPDNMAYCPLDDTFFKKTQDIKQNSHDAIDGIEEAWITEAGLEMAFGNECAILDGVGCASLLSE